MLYSKEIVVLVDKEDKHVFSFNEIEDKKDFVLYLENYEAKKNYPKDEIIYTFLDFKRDAIIKNDVLQLPTRIMEESIIWINECLNNYKNEYRNN